MIYEYASEILGLGLSGHPLRPSWFLSAGPAQTWFLLHTGQQANMSGAQVHTASVIYL